MPSTTPFGYPYPLPTEPVAEGAAAIRALAEAVDVRGLQKLGDVLLAAPGFFSFSSIPQTCRHLLLIASLRSAYSAAAVMSAIRCNANSNAAYTYGVMGVDNATAANSFSHSHTAINIANSPGAASAAGNFGALFAFFPNYPAAIMHAVVGGGFAASGTEHVRFSGGLYTAADPLTNVQLFSDVASNFAVGSRATLYGLA